jgi:glutathione S-transferase
MVVDERSRHELYRRLEEVLGPDAATTLIEHLPPVGWADVATKHDLAGLEQRLELRFTRVDDRFTRVDDRFAVLEERFAVLEERIDDRFALNEERIDDRFALNEERSNAAMSDLRGVLEHELRSQTTTVIFGLVGMVLTMAALAVALVRLT